MNMQRSQEILARRRNAFLRGEVSFPGSFGVSMSLLHVEEERLEYGAHVLGFEWSSKELLREKALLGDSTEHGERL